MQTCSWTKKRDYGPPKSHQSVYPLTAPGMPMPGVDFVRTTIKLIKRKHMAPSKPKRVDYDTVKFRLINGMLFFIGNPDLIKHINQIAFPPVYLPADVLHTVETFIEKWRKLLSPLMKMNADGGIPYWDENWHGEITSLLQRLHPHLSLRDISNAVSSLGF